jgi:hypothetical protein
LFLEANRFSNKVMSNMVKAYNEIVSIPIEDQIVSMSIVEKEN